MPSAPPDSAIRTAVATALTPAVPVAAAPFTLLPHASAADSLAQRPRAVEYSDAYYTRLEIHRLASYATIPLFVGQYFVGQSLYNNPPGSSGTRTLHSAIAMGIGGLFAVNTVTGVWNLWDGRHVPEGRARRYIHAALMLTADAGFLYVASQAPNRRSVQGRLNDHRNVALISMGLSLSSYGMMLVWK